MDKKRAVAKKSSINNQSANKNKSYLIIIAIVLAIIVLAVILYNQANLAKSPQTLPCFDCPGTIKARLRIPSIAGGPPVQTNFDLTPTQNTPAGTGGLPEYGTADGTDPNEGGYSLAPGGNTLRITAGSNLGNHGFMNIKVTKGGQPETVTVMGTIGLGNVIANNVLPTTAGGGRTFAIGVDDNNDGRPDRTGTLAIWCA